MKLVVEDEQAAVEEAIALIQQARRQISEAGFQQKVVELIETIVVYKMTQLTREEIEAMFGLQELKQTRYFQEVGADFKEEGRLEGKLEGKLESVPGLLALGLTVEQIAGALGLDVEMVQQAADGESVTDVSQDEDTIDREPFTDISQDEDTLGLD